MELGYELFLDRETLKAHFTEADIFDVEGPLKQLEEKMDIIHIGLFLHLFDLEGQVKACERILSLMKPEKGCLIVGQQIGSLEPGPMAVGSKMYKHNVEGFEKMWEEAWAENSKQVEGQREYRCGTRRRPVQTC